MKKMLAIAAVLAAAASAFADVYIIDGKRVEGEVHEINGTKTICTDEMCMVLPPDAKKVEEGETPPAPEGVAEPAAAEAAPVAPTPSAATPSAAPTAAAPTARMAMGYMGVDDFLSFLKGGAAGSGAEADGGKSSLEGKSWWLVLLLVLFGGLCMNLTPCVLPMVPINLMVIGKSALRGALYGLGIAVAYGAMGLLAALGGMAFGEIQGNPWFNAAIAVLFVCLALALLDVFFIDLSGRRNNMSSMRQSMLPGLFAFFMGVVGAVLAGACVAPILISVLLLTANLSAQGHHAFAFALPFVLGVGMALPWPFAGAGMQVLPKPGAWMKAVNKVFAVVVLGFAAYYGYLAWKGFTRPESGVAGLERRIAEARRPVLVDCWATWCKNCTAMEKTTLADGRVKAALEGWTVIRCQAEDISELNKVPGFEDVKGLPAFVVFE